MSPFLLINAIVICLTCISCVDFGGGLEPDAQTNLSDAGQTDAAIDAGFIPRPDRFRIATWNMACLRDDSESVFCNTEESGEVYIRNQGHIDELVAHAQGLDADMVFVQEVENPAACRRDF